MAPEKFWWRRRLISYKSQVISYKAIDMSTLYPQRMILVTCYLLLMTAAPGYLSAQQESDSQLDKFLHGLETFSAAFEQRLYSEGGQVLEKSSGVFYLRRPGMFRWVYNEPYSQLIISDGNALWIYEEDLEQVVIKDISGNIEDSPAAILGGDLDLDAHYLIVDMGMDKGIDWLELTPRSADSQYKSVRLGFKDNHIAAMTLYDYLGQENFITFINTERNSPLKKELFQFEVPEGVDVIDERP